MCFLSLSHLLYSSKEAFNDDDSILLYQVKVTPNEAFVNRPKKIDLWQMKYLSTTSSNLLNTHS